MQKTVKNSSLWCQVLTAILIQWQEILGNYLNNYGKLSYQLHYYEICWMMTCINVAMQKSSSPLALAAALLLLFSKKLEIYCIFQYRTLKSNMYKTAYNYAVSRAVRFGSYL